MIEPVRPVSLGDIEDARKRIAGTVLRTPLVKLDVPGPAEIYLKLENLQPTNAYKIRGATNAVARLSDEQRARGVWTISAGNAGQGVAYAARAFGIPCSIVAIETAPQTKLDRMRALGATIIPVSYEVAWRAAESHAFEGMDGTFGLPGEAGGGASDASLRPAPSLAQSVKVRRPALDQERRRTRPSRTSEQEARAGECGGERKRSQNSLASEAAVARRAEAAARPRAPARSRDALAALAAETRPVHRGIPFPVRTRAGSASFRR